jgi:Tol biopolymer transport system component
MLKVLRFFLVVTALAMSGPPLAAGQAGSDLFQRALAKERAEGQLVEAIKIYERIVKQHSADRALAAKALLQLGVCYEKLGDAGARKAYEQLLRDFGDQRESAASARARLAAMTARPSTPARLTLNRVYEGHGLDWCNGLSSDGRYLSFPDWTTGNVGLIDTRTGESRRVSNDGSINHTHSQGEYTECSVISPDDRQVAYFWQRGTAGAELRTISVDGSRRRVVYADPQGRYMRPFDWSSDGSRILFGVWGKDGPSELSTVPAAGGAPRTVKKFDLRVDYAVLSPDGRSIAYSLPASTTSRVRDLFVVGADGTRESPVARQPTDDFPLGWSADSARLIFASDRTGSLGIWSIDIDNGQPRGVPALLKQDLGALIPIRYVNGTLFYLSNGRADDVYVAGVDAAAGRLTSTPRLARAYASGANSAPDWSPDGASLAYRTIRTPADVLRPPPLFSVLDLRTGAERQLRPSFDVMDPFAEGPRWSPDAKSLLVIAHKQSPQHGIYRVDVETGATTLLVQGNGRMMTRVEWAPDGQSIFCLESIASGTVDRPTRIVRRYLATGRELELVALVAPGGVPKIAVSPDGRHVAFTTIERGATAVKTLSVVAADGGPPRELYRAAESENVTTPVWSPDGGSIFFRKAYQSDTATGPSFRWETWRIAANGGPARRVDIPGGSAFRFSPDGRQIAFSDGEQRRELWALENLIPQAPRAAAGGARQRR